MLLVLLLGCGSGPTVATTPLRTVPLCEPWADWALPLAPASGEASAVVQCDERHLVVHFPPALSSTLAPQWQLAVLEAGFEEDIDSSAPGLVNVRYLQEGQLLNLSLIDEAERTLVILTLVARPPTEPVYP